uniref:Uncharacterized protein n=1 Tax=Rhizophora mucronata TaxID=61149 RepID=A0A2P2N6R8_RHIMU
MKRATGSCPSSSNSIGERSTERERELDFRVGAAVGQESRPEKERSRLEVFAGRRENLGVYY